MLGRYGLDKLHATPIWVDPPAPPRPEIEVTTGVLDSITCNFTTGPVLGRGPAGSPSRIFIPFWPTTTPAGNVDELLDPADEEVSARKGE